MICAILRGLIRNTFADCIAKFVAKSPNSFFGGTSNSIDGNSAAFSVPSPGATFITAPLSTIVPRSTILTTRLNRFIVS